MKGDTDMDEPPRGNFYCLNTKAIHSIISRLKHKYSDLAERSRFTDTAYRDCASLYGRVKNIHSPHALTKMKV